MQVSVHRSVTLSSDDIKKNNAKHYLLWVPPSSWNANNPRTSLGKYGFDHKLRSLLDRRYPNVNSWREFRTCADNPDPQNEFWMSHRKTNAIEEQKSDVYKYKVKNIEDNNRTYINNINSQNEFWIKSWTWFSHTSCELSMAFSITCFGLTLLYSVMLMLSHC